MSSHHTAQLDGYNEVGRVSVLTEIRVDSALIIFNFKLNSFKFYNQSIITSSIRIFKTWSIEYRPSLS